MTLKERNAMQIAEALGEVNRYYFYLKYGREGTSQELLEYYICESSGAKDFRKNHE